jgi:hypothetical protein
VLITIMLHYCVRLTAYFRLRLIKFSTLYSKRNVPSVRSSDICSVISPRRCVAQYRRRVEDFYDALSDSSFSESLFEQRMSKSPRRPAPQPRHDEQAILLADLVLMVVGLSAARATLFEDDKASAHKGWVDLAGEFML